MSLPLSRVVLAAALASSSAGCGYHLANDVRDPLGPYVVTSAPARVPFAESIAAAEAGARSELARAGQLGRCSRPVAECGQIVVELLRVDERAEGVALAPGAAPGGGTPLGRGLRVTVVGRASVRVGDVEQRVTGDMSATEVVTSELPDEGARRTPLAELAKAEALRRAARRLGERLVRRILGAPEPTAE